MTTTSNRTNAKTSKSEKLLGINDVAQKLDMSYHEAHNFLVRVPVAKTGERGAHLYRLEDITKAALIRNKFFPEDKDDINTKAPILKGKYQIETQVLKNGH